MTVLVFIMWFVPGPPTSFAHDFETAAACADARDGIAAQLGKTGATFFAECFPRGEVKL